MNDSGSNAAPRVRQGRVMINSVSSMAAQLLAMAIGLWFTPFLVHRLGVEVYGLVPLALLVVSYFALVTDSINVFVGRDFSALLAQDDRPRADRVYGTATLLNLALGGACMGLGMALAPFAPDFFRVPAGWEGQAQWLFAAAAAGFFLTCLGAVPSSVLFGHNRLELKAGVATLSNLARVAIVVAAFAWWGPSLHWLSASIVGAAAVAWAGNQTCSNRLERHLRFRPAQYDRAMAAGYLREGGWVMLNQIGSILYLKIDLLVVNWFLGATASGRYALALQWSNVLRSLTGTLTGAFAPTIMMRAGLGDQDGMVRFARQAIRMTGVLLALLIGGLCGFSRPLLETWVGIEYADLAPLLAVLIGHLTVNIAVSPLFAVQVAVGKVKVPGLVTFFMGLLNLLLALAAVGPLGGGAMGVAVAGALVLLAKNAVFTPLYAAAIMGRPWHVFVGDLLRVAVATLVVGAVAYGMARCFDVSGWLGLAAGGTATTVLCAPGIWWLYLPAEDRADARAYVRRKWAAWKPSSSGKA